MTALPKWTNGCKKMVRVVLKGIHHSKVKLADGSYKTYYYAWKGGPRITGKPGSAQFIDEYNQAVRQKNQRTGAYVGALVSKYKATAFQKCKPATQRGYRPILKEIEGLFGTMPLPVTDKDFKQCRRVFLDWRDTKADRPRTADLAWSVLKLVMEFGVDRSIISRNPCQRGGRLWTPERKGNVWTDDLLSVLLANCSYEVGLVCRVALETGQRQGDILGLKWSSFTGERLEFIQGKRGHLVSILLTKALADEINALPRDSIFICLSTKGTPWTSDGFRASFNTAKLRAGIQGLRFHDFRGTAITRAYNGLKDKDLSALSTRFGISMVSIQALLDKHYLAQDQDKADGIVRLMEAKR